MTRPVKQPAWMRRPVWIELAFLRSVHLGVVLSREAFAIASGRQHSEHDADGWSNPNGGYCWTFRPIKTVVLAFDAAALGKQDWYCVAGLIAHEAEHATELIAELIGQEHGRFTHEVQAYLMQHVVTHVGHTVDAALRGKRRLDRLELCGISWAANSAR